MKSKMARKSLKTLLVTLTLSAVLALPVTAATPAAPQKGMGDAARIFETHAAVPLQAAELSAQEMEDTEGAWGPWGAVGGGFLGGVGYAGHAITSGQWSWYGFGISVGTGAVSGAIAGPSSYTTIVLQRPVVFAGGALSGLGR